MASRSTRSAASAAGTDASWARRSSSGTSPAMVHPPTRVGSARARSRARPAGTSSVETTAATQTAKPTRNTPWSASAIGRPASSRWAMTAPMTESPTAPPMDMKNCVIDVAAPRSLRGTALWTAISIGTTTRPMPTPASRTSRIASAWLRVADQRAPGQAERGRAQHGGARPGPGAPRLHDAEQERGHASGEEGHARHVHDGPARGARLLDERGGDQRHRDRPERQVDVEHPPPRDVVGEHAAEPGAHQGGDAPDARDPPLQLRAALEPEELADDRVAERHQRPGAEPLHHPEHDQLRHALRGPRERRAPEERREPDQEDRPAAVEIREPPPERHRDRLREQEAREDPRVDLDPAEASHDRRHRRRDDGGLHCREENGQHDPDEDAPLRPLLHQWPPVQPAQRHSPRSAG